MSKKKYRVTIDPNTAFTFTVEAQNVSEAKKKAWERYLNKKRRMKDHKTYVDQIRPNK